MTISPAFDVPSVVAALAGGALVGCSAGSLLLLNGRIAGISGIVGGLLTPQRGETGWRLSFVAGLVVGGLLLTMGLADPFRGVATTSPVRLVLAGLLVGFGARRGNGCTSGHGVCGIGRLSYRSIVATLTFMAAGMLTVLLSRHVIGGVP